jgi:hypothetical protein
VVTLWSYALVAPDVLEVQHTNPNSYQQPAAVAGPGVAAKAPAAAAAEAPPVAAKKRRPHAQNGIITFC